MPDGKQVFSVYDFIGKACNYSENCSNPRKTFSRLIGADSEFSEELLELRHTYKFPGNYSLQA